MTMGPQVDSYKLKSDQNIGSYTTLNSSLAAFSINNGNEKLSYFTVYNGVVRYEYFQPKNVAMIDYACSFNKTVTSAILAAAGLPALVL